MVLLSLLLVRLEDDPEGVDDAGDDPDHGQHDVEEEVAAAAPHDQDRQGREEESEDEGDQLAAVSHPDNLK